MALRRRGSRVGASAELLVVGLGNPGDEYAGTRHNAGRWAAEELMRRHGGRLRRARRLHALSGELRVGGRLMAVATLVTYMNDSGRAVRPLLRRYGIDDVGRLVVVHDELDLPAGRLKLRRGGGLAGHKGLKSIRASLRSDEFTRVRIGIGRPGAVVGKPVGAGRGGRPDREDRVVKHVLGRPGRAERILLDSAVARAADAVECLCEHGLATAMNRFNVA